LGDRGIGITKLTWRGVDEASSFACKVPFALQLDNTNGNYS